jgi:hypothetical protein
LLSVGFEDQPRDFVGMGDQREMAGLHLDGLGFPTMGEKKTWCDSISGLVERDRKLKHRPQPILSGCP